MSTLPSDHSEALRDLLIVAAELQEYSGYLSTTRRTQMQNLQARFDSQRRVIVFDLLKRSEDVDAIKQAVSDALDLILQERWIREDAIYYAREELLTHLDKQARNNPLQRFIVRWGPPSAMAAVAVVYLVVKFT
ncbi:hypothetical protein [Sphingosinithalassobacter portus]|uniref:hypothetical protein n=1 Tax=Stakelama portus TaxID=2676234 RepID=UPI0011AB58F1|nr:hypothetical protein [Sphingosinithalassobacter portus]